MNQQELTQALGALATQAAKTKAEILAKVAALEGAIANSGQTSTEVDNALQALRSEIQGLDDLNADAVTPPAPAPSPADPV